MATSRLMALHIGKERTVSHAISDIIDYVENPQKTDNGRLISSYECDSRTVDAVCYKGWFRITATNYSMATAHP